jgi:hypothetical protein
LVRCLGILREVQNSPNRETDDALILDAVLEQLRDLGASAERLMPEEADRRDLSSYGLLLPMCEAYPRIKRLAGIAERSGSIWANAPSAVLNCYRLKMIELLGSLPGVRFPRCEVRLVRDRAAAAPFDAAGYWIKRGDVHNTCDHDVVFLDAWPQSARVLQDFAEREISHYVVQPHVEGDVIKFYGVGPGRWFTWFHHDPTRARRTPFVVGDLARMAAAGAGALGLEIFGGDAIVSPDGTLTLLDLNSWPSFARVRREAALQIAWHLQTRWLSQPRLTSKSEAGIPRRIP